MADLAALKLEIATELAKDNLESGGDLEATLLKHIQDACEYFSDTKFWFNSIITTATTSAGVSTVAIPSTVRVIERLTIPAYGTELCETVLSRIDDGTEQGMPCTYAYYNDTMKISPIPDATYTLNIYGIAAVAAPTTGTDSSIWTNQASRLIRARTKQTLARGVFRDPEGATLFAAEVGEELTRLKRETARRLVTPLRSARNGRYSITADR